MALCAQSATLWLLKSTKGKFTLLYTFGTLLGENVWNIPKQKIGLIRVTLGTWLIGCVIISASYGGELRAFLMTPNYEKEIDTMKDVLDSGLPWNLILYGEEIEGEMAGSDDPIIRGQFLFTYVLLKFSQNKGISG